MTVESLRAIRTSKKLTQDALGERAGVTQKMIAAIENGYRKPSDELKRNLARTLRRPQSSIHFGPETVGR